MIRAIRWCGYAWLIMVMTLTVGLLAVEWAARGTDHVMGWLTVEYLAILGGSLVPGIAMILMEVLFERRHGIDEDR